MTCLNVAVYLCDKRLIGVHPRVLLGFVLLFSFHVMFCRSLFDASDYLFGIFNLLTIVLSVL
jgi:hypothetical protein